MQVSVDDSLVAELADDVWQNQALLQNTRRHEAVIYRKKFRENFTLKVTVISRCVEHLRNMVRALNAIEGDGYDIILSREMEDLAETGGKALVAFMQDRPSAAKNDLEAAAADLNARFRHIRKEGLIRRFDTEKLVQVFSFYSSLLYLTEDILSGIDALSGQMPGDAAFDQGPLAQSHYG